MGWAGVLLPAGVSVATTVLTTLIWRRIDWSRSELRVLPLEVQHRTDRWFAEAWVANISGSTAYNVEVSGEGCDATFQDEPEPDPVDDLSRRAQIAWGRPKRYRPPRGPFASIPAGAEVPLLITGEPESLATARIRFTWTARHWWRGMEDRDETKTLASLMTRPT